MTPGGSGGTSTARWARRPTGASPTAPRIEPWVTSASSGTARKRGTVELGYFLLSSARGRGAATAAGRLALTYAFTPVEAGGLGMRRAIALTVGDNDASSAVLQRLGFAEWGREPAFCAREDGSFDDARHWVLRASPTSA